MSGMALPRPTTLRDMYDFTISDNMYTGQRKDESRKSGYDGRCNYCHKKQEPPCSSCWRPSKATALAVLSAGLMAATIVIIVCLHVTFSNAENKIVDIHELVNANRRYQHRERNRPIGINGTATATPTIDVKTTPTINITPTIGVTTMSQHIHVASSSTDATVTPNMTSQESNHEIIADRRSNSIRFRRLNYLSQLGRPGG